MIVPERTIRVEPEREGDVFFNVGVITNLPLSFQNFRLTAGFGKMYVSAVLNPFYLFGGGGHVKTYNGNMLEINGAGRVVNFPSSTGNYYAVNESVISSRIGLTVGALFNLRYLTLNAGAGYGTRDLYRGLDMRSYSTNNLQSKVWAKSIEDSWRGLSMDAGIYKSFKRINVMMGLHTIIDPDRKMPFVEMSMGLGLPFNRK